MSTQNKNHSAQQHFLDIETLSVRQIESILEKAKSFKSTGTVPLSLSGKIVLSMFFENSTRTRTSFELAAKRLGANVVNWNASTSSVNKGETFEDTVANLNALGPDLAIMRHNGDDAIHSAARIMLCPIVSAGAGTKHHPTQALLDAMTMLEHKGTLNGLRIAFCGDLKHSRVAYSNIALLSNFGADIHAISPPALQIEKLPENCKSIKHFQTLEEGLPGCDVVMTIRIQKERMDQIACSDSNYFSDCGLTQERLALAKPDAIVMDPGPLNRGVQITDEVADGPQSVILKQVENGLFVRMAVLDTLLGGQT